MDDKLPNILDSLPEKPPRSRLEPYSELIEELRRRGRTYREIAHILGEKCHLETAASTIHDFVRVRSGNTRIAARDQRPTAPRVGPEVVAARARGVNAERKNEPPTADVQQRIVALKARSAPRRPSPQQFQYDPNEPLHLPAKTRKI